MLSRVKVIAAIVRCYACLELVQCSPCVKKGYPEGKLAHLTVSIRCQMHKEQIEAVPGSMDEK